ncbi:MAG: glycosyltransferase family 4 protein [Actinobacteria bacterium]|nr:MAG: glycosyltransferase family 4 protein [Actinomycetota bacterium]
MKVGIVVPYSWSFWGGVPEHADHQARALERLGVTARIMIGHDPPGRLTKYLHPRVGRHERPPAHVIPIGRSVIVPANGALPNIVLSPRAVFRMRQVLARERFDLLHVHEPMTPAIGVAALSFARVPLVATFHASGELAWMKLATPVWGFLAERLDHRIAVSQDAADSARRYLPGDYEVIPNGVAMPERADPAGRENRIVFLGRHEPRKGLQVLLRAWPEIRRQTGARLRVLGADPLQVRLLLTRLRVSDDGVDALGFVSERERTEELLKAKAFVAPSLHGESFGMVLTEAFACATPVVASDIPGYRDVMTPETGVLIPANEPHVLAQATVNLLADEPRRQQLGAGARRRARAYSWDDIGRRLLAIYERVATGSPAALAAAG